MEGTIFQVFLYGLLGVPSHQFFVQNCNVTVSPNDTMCYVSCIGMDLTTVPAVHLQLPIHVKELDISRNAISEVKLTDFRNVSSLRALDMSSNNICRIDYGTFQELIHLRELYMSRNRLKYVTKGCLEGLVSLSVLRFDQNEIQQIDPSAFVSLLNLTHVNLGSNRLTRMESVKTILHLPNLFEFKIDNNIINSFVSRDLSSTPLQLRRLDLFSNPLRTFNITNNVLPHLHYLGISLDCSYYFQWIVVDQSFLGSVETLNVSASQISYELTAEIAQTFNSSLRNLQVSFGPGLEYFLEMTCSQVRNLRLVAGTYQKRPVLSDHFFKSCHQLQVLYFTDTSTSKISPLAFHGLNQLQRLSVKNTMITKFNNITHVLPTLSQLDFSYNHINQVTCSDFSNLPLLERLNLYRNQICTLSKCTFQNLPNLQVLKLGSNNLLSVRHIFHGHLPKLRVLDLHRNKISRLDTETFKGLGALRHLNIYDNQIDSLSENAFDGLHNLKELVLTGNHLHKLTDIYFHNIFRGMESLEELNLNENNIAFNIHFLKQPPFVKLKSLKKLLIADQRRGMPNLPCNLLKGLSSLTSFHGSNLNMQYVCPEAFSYTPKLRYLDLSKNAFTMDNSLSPRVFHPIPALSVLNLEQSLLTSLNFVIDADLSQLINLQIKNNQVQVINQTIMESLPNLRNIDLRNNKFICDCSNEWLLHWANKSTQTQVIYFNKYQCSYPPAAQGQYLEDLNTSSCTLDLEFIYFVGSSSLVIVTLLVAFTYDFVRFQLVYAYYLLLAYLYENKRQRKQKQHGFLYDAFVSYNSHDELWVLQELLPHLETEQGWRLCLHHRDFEPGKPIIDNIVDGIYSSRKTICVVTQDYLKSEWCSKEILVASFRLFDENNDVLILVLLEDIPAQQLSPYHRMRKLVKKQTYLCWPKHGEDKKIFWEKLRMAMSAKKEDNHILSGREEGIVME